MTVSIEKDGPVTIVTLSRPEVRNAVDRETAQELADAFRSFESDKKAKVAVFYGDQGQFCAGADLKKISEGKPNRVDETENRQKFETSQLRKNVIHNIGYCFRLTDVILCRVVVGADTQFAIFS